MSKGWLDNLGAQIDRLTGFEGSLGYIAIATALIVGYNWISNSIMPPQPDYEPEEEEEPEPPRNFTKEQLKSFDGTTTDRGEVKPVYLSLGGTVFDVSNGRDFYGPGGPYEVFAGRECGVALAKMSFDEEHLDDVKGCAELNFGEKSELEGWTSKFQYYRGYPVMGKLVVDMPDPEREISLEELAGQPGTTDELPEGYAAAPIFVGVDGLVFDMSFGGIGFYGPGGPYAKFAGRDVTRALALMKIDVAEEDSADISDCTEKQVGIMKDWVKTFRERKQYPVVGKLVK